MHLNILFLSRLPGPLNGEIAMGYYNPASSVCRSTLIFPQSFGQAALPVVAANTGNLKMVEVIIEKSTKSLMSVIIFPLVLATTFSPEQILTIIFGGKYLASAPALTILGWACALQIFNAPVSVTLSASKEIRRFIPWAGLVFSVNLILAVPLIIYYSFIGAAIAFLISKVVETILRHYLLQTIWGIGSFKTMESFLKVLLPIILAFIIMILAKTIGGGTIVLFVLALILYFFCIFFFKDLREGITILINGLRKKTLGEPG